jgi:site-specific recombinase XerD
MKRANGTGGVIKLSGARRRPYMARITTGISPDGKPIKKVVGYFATRDEATAALIDYNKSPYDIDNRQITTAELYQMWVKRTELQGRLSPKTVKNIKSSFKYCENLYNMPYSLIKAHMMQSCVDSCGHGYATQKAIKHFFYQLDELAYELDIINKKYSDIIHTGTPNPKQKTIFKDAEVMTLWENIDKPWVDTILILLYSGWRVSELLGLLKKNVVIDPSGKTVNYMQGGIKTKAGKDRMVPIHSVILPLVKKRYDTCNTHLIEKNGEPVRYGQYHNYFPQVMAELGMKHTIHETRHTFRTWFNRTPARIPFINKIMGHKCGDIGLDVYTHKVMDELRDTIELIKPIQYP